eukprot:SAG22_NODE_920_length_6497_cov_7.779775_2_plen_46_part_01
MSVLGLVWVVWFGLAGGKGDGGRAAVASVCVCSGEGGGMAGFFTYC